MTRKTKKTIQVLAPLTLVLIALAALIVPGAPLAPQAGHGVLHLNCPPGSHGKPRFTGVGQSLEKARDDARAARSLEDRAITVRP